MFFDWLFNWFKPKKEEVKEVKPETKLTSIRQEIIKRQAETYKKPIERTKKREVARSKDTIYYSDGSTEIIPAYLVDWSDDNKNNYIDSPVFKGFEEGHTSGGGASGGWEDTKSDSTPHYTPPETSHSSDHSSHTSSPSCSSSHSNSSDSSSHSSSCSSHSSPSCSSSHSSCSSSSSSCSSSSCSSSSCSSGGD